MSAPVEGHDVRVVSLAGSYKAPVGGFVDVDVVIVRTDGEVLVVWREGHNLDPFSRVSEELDLTVRGRGGSDGDGTVISSNGKELAVDSDTARALSLWHSRESGCFTSFRFVSSVGDLDGLEARSSVRVPHHDLVVISRGTDFAVRSNNETPDFTVGVRLHDIGLLAGGRDEGDGTITLTDKELS